MHICLHGGRELFRDAPDVEIVVSVLLPALRCVHHSLKARLVEVGLVHQDQGLDAHKHLERTRRHNYFNHALLNCHAVSIASLQSTVQQVNDA